MKTGRVARVSFIIVTTWTGHPTPIWRYVLLQSVNIGVQMPLQQGVRLGKRKAHPSSV